ncbi:MAG TPA: DUF4350 domain-containing protein [Vicinamibacteria bacterium]|jgi:hypothetical protein|nr:DUF4350 domain-containing protein [Vicinamibacteria bacterium]
MKRFGLLSVALPAAAYFTAALLWLQAQRPRAGLDTIAPGSALDTSSGGTSLAYRYLKRRAAGAEWLRRPFEYAGVDANAVVFRIRPWGGLSFDEEDDEKPAASRVRRLLSPGEERWLWGGGRLVLALDRPVGSFEVTTIPAAPAVKVYPAWPGVERLEPATPRGLAGSGLADAHTVFAAGEAPLVARVPRGKGEIVLLAAPEMLENERLGRADHLALLAALAGERPVYFDERQHGLGTEVGLVELLAGWGLGPALVLLGLLALCAFWRGRARLGPPDADPPDLRSEAVDLVDSLGKLYGRALMPEAALDLYRASLARALSSRTGLKGAALEARLAALAGPSPPRSRGKLPPAEFRHRLQTLNEAFRRLTHAHPR